MPQSLSRVKKITFRLGGPGIILKRPELAALVAAVMTSWSHAEAAFGRFLALCLRTDSAAGLAMYLSLSGAEARRTALAAAAHTTLDADTFKLFELVMRAIKSVRERRNNFAHGIWSVSDELPDALLWLSADDEVVYFDYDKSALKRSNIMVYTKNDLTRELRDAKEAVGCVHKLEVLVNPANSELHEKTRTMLLGSPLLKRLGESQSH